MWGTPEGSEVGRLVYMDFTVESGLGLGIYLPTYLRILSSRPNPVLFCSALFRSVHRACKTREMIVGHNFDSKREGGA